MNKFVLFIVFLSGFLTYLNAQDVIVLRNSSEIESKVLEIDDTCVMYKEWEHLDGQTYNVQKVEILFIKYANGNKEVFNNEESIPENHRSERPFVKKGSFQTYISLGYYTGNRNLYVGYISKDHHRSSSKIYSGGIDITGSFGARINDFVYVGLMTGVSLINFKHLMIPVSVDFRVYYPINRNFHPFIEISQGIDGVPLGMLALTNDYFSHNYIGNGRIIYLGNIGIGIDERAGSLSLGWYRFAVYNSFYIRIGINPCWNKIKKK